jgi:chromosome segregation ATPase
MQFGNRSSLLLALMCVLGFGLVSVYRTSFAARAEAVPAPQQDVIRLEARVGQLEQRLYSMESNLRLIEQQSRLAGGSPRDTTRDLELLRSEVQSLQVRLVEDECGLAKLDERTLSPAAREVRRKSGLGGNEACRRGFDTPLRLPAN